MVVCGNSREFTTVACSGGQERVDAITLQVCVPFPLLGTLALCSSIMPHGSLGGCARGCNRACFPSHGCVAVGVAGSSQKRGKHAWIPLDCNTGNTFTVCMSWEMGLSAPLRMGPLGRLLLIAEGGGCLRFECQPRWLNLAMRTKGQLLYIHCNLKTSESVSKNHFFPPLRGAQASNLWCFGLVLKSAAMSGSCERVAIKVGGVPEHFNRPWHMAREQNMWEAANISVSAGVVERKLVLRCFAESRVASFRIAPHFPHPCR